MRLDSTAPPVLYTYTEPPSIAYPSFTLNPTSHYLLILLHHILKPNSRQPTNAAQHARTSSMPFVRCSSHLVQPLLYSAPRHPHPTGVMDFGLI
ncbi:Hypothetical protein NTJ_03365 [Nesidiocoris tenuis]|uniref:Uncharacterized protein n=1 Tax=Nesidiocoris tenuis TaxID=355587 RepID=A0ABN7AH04_9HEMI|nr:Hypothetical protein NTJ_03365 [Nesidiocoris tenuis]